MLRCTVEAPNRGRNNRRDFVFSFCPTVWPKSDQTSGINCWPHHNRVRGAAGRH
jgi:hypothetical protein